MNENVDKVFHIPFHGSPEDLGFRLGSVIHDFCGSPLILGPVEKLAGAGPGGSIGILGFRFRGEDYILSALRSDNREGPGTSSLTYYHLGEFPSLARQADVMDESRENDDPEGDSANFIKGLRICPLLNIPEEAGRLGHILMGKLAPGFVADEMIGIVALTIHLLDRLISAGPGEGSGGPQAVSLGFGSGKTGMGVGVSRSGIPLDVLPRLLLKP